MDTSAMQDAQQRPPGSEQRVSVFEELPEEAFTVQQTLSFVSPRAFGDNARRVKGVLDDHEVARKTSPDIDKWLSVWEACLAMLVL
jgi:hypothetical protein